MRIRKLETSRDLKRFIQFPYDLYRDIPYWVPPLRLDIKQLLSPKKNPFFEHGRVQGFLAEDEQGATLGRIAGIINGMHLQKYGDSVGFFGFFEAVNDFEVAEALIRAAEGWLLEQEMTAVRGPVNPSLNDVAGLLVSGFEKKPFVMMPYNMDYYPDFFQRLGYERAMTMWAYFLHRKHGKFEKLWRGRDLILRRYPNLTVRTIDMSRFDVEAQAILDIYNEAWSENWGHVPMTDAEFAKIAKEMKQIVEPELVIIVEDEGEPIAFALSLPNINQALQHVSDGRLFPSGILQLLLRMKFGGVTTVRTMLMGVRKGYRGRGLDSVLVACTVENSYGLGYSAGELSWVLDSNEVLLNHLESIGAVKDKEYVMLEKQLESGQSG
ncbi:MAG: hypothetical protein KJO98_02150 [Rhodothermia bacterium]|nr:hypothetical protein [Rhodothermia bacterium]